LLDLRERLPLATQVQELANERVRFRCVARRVVDDPEGALLPVGDEMRRATEPDRRPTASSNAAHDVWSSIVGKHALLRSAVTCLRIRRVLTILSSWATAPLADSNRAMCFPICCFSGLKSTIPGFSNPEGCFGAVLRGAAFLAGFFFADALVVGRAPLRFLATRRSFVNLLSGV